MFSYLRLDLLQDLSYTVADLRLFTNRELHRGDEMEVVSLSRTDCMLLDRVVPDA